MKKKSVLILGALSDIAKSIAHRFGENGYELMLAARNKEELKIQADDLKIRYNVDVNFYEFDVIKNNSHENFIKNLKELPSVIILAIGLMGDQEENEKNSDLRTKILRTNFEGPINILSMFANIYEKQGSGTIVGISSVAGERGRSLNYIYGSAKAGFSTFLSGLRNRLEKKNIHVCLIILIYIYFSYILYRWGPLVTLGDPWGPLGTLYNSNPPPVYYDIIIF